ncbi:MAG: aldo/keto reductase [Desulfovibrio sp.]|uniref:aldo/keto reductase n=1 Tax=Desulfovibrio sp. 7SRBS1 TaxID=3378064 RepID=UPI003B413885
MNETNAFPPLPRVPFGTTGLRVTRVGLGGKGILRTFGQETGAQIVIQEALHQGLALFDTAPAYMGSEGYLGATWEKDPQARKSVFLADKSGVRDRDGALHELDASLKRLHTDHLDLWQLHDVHTREDFQAIARPGGALEAFVQAKEAGKVRSIGVSGHFDPDILARCLEQWPLDCVVMPVNVVEGASENGFLQNVLPIAQDKGMAVIGTRVFGGGHYINPQGYVTPELLLRYALSLPVTAVVVGCSMADHVRILARALRDHRPMDEAMQNELLEPFRPHARRMAFYRKDFQAE